MGISLKCLCEQLQLLWLYYPISFIDPTEAPTPAPAPITQAPIPNLCAGKTLSCQALEGADGCDSATGQCRCGNKPACDPSSTMPVCYNPGRATAFCGCRFSLNNEPTSCKEPNPTCNPLTATCQVVYLFVTKLLVT